MLNFRHLRFWCQKVLPLVYDDSLSYYELLCKVVAYLNNLTDDVVKLTEAVAGIEDTTLRKIAEELQRMVRDGSLADILNSIAIDGRLVTNKYLEDLPKMPESYTVYDGLENVTASDIYQWYDDLLDEHRDCMNKVTWGTDEDGEPLAYYTYSCESKRKTPAYDGQASGETTYSRSAAYTANNMVFFSGIHGNEKQTTWTLFNIVKAIVEGNGKAYNYIKNNINLIVVPCVNPYGLTHNTKLNKNGVNINRNFPHMWEEYEGSGSDVKGDSAGSELSTRFCMDILSGLDTKKNHNGTVIIDFHEFEGKVGAGEPDEYAGYYMMAMANDPDYRIALTKAGMNMLDYYEANYPMAISEAPTPIRVVSNTYTPLLVNYAYYMGFRYAELLESRTNLFNTQYDEATHNAVYYSCALSIASVGLGFVASKRLSEILELSVIGCDSDSSLEEILTAMPPKTHYSVNVNNTMAIWNDIPVLPNGNRANGILEITTSNEDRVNAVLEYSIKTQHNNYKWHAVAYQSGNTVIVSDWAMEQPKILNARDFELTGSSGAGLSDIIQSMLSTATNVFSIQLDNSYDNLRADMPILTNGNLTIITNYTDNVTMGGIAIFSNRYDGFYVKAIGIDGATSVWEKVVTEPVIDT